MCRLYNSSIELLMKEFVRGCTTHHAYFGRQALRIAMFWFLKGMGFLSACDFSSCLRITGALHATMGVFYVNKT